MRFTVWCPIDGAVEVSADDVTTIVLRSGSDVEVSFGCPVCGALIAIRTQVPPGLVRLLGAARRDPPSTDTKAWVAAPAVLGRSADDRSAAYQSRRIDAYVEYFRRELAAADTVESMLAFMDSGAGR